MDRDFEVNKQCEGGINEAKLFSPTKPILTIVIPIYCFFNNKVCEMGEYTQSERKRIITDSKNREHKYHIRKHVSHLPAIPTPTIPEEKKFVTVRNKIEHEKYI